MEKIGKLLAIISTILSVILLVALIHSFIDEICGFFKQVSKKVCNNADCCNVNEYEDFADV